MEKLSGILAGSPRVTAADMKEANPVRSGAPSFGRSEVGVRSERMDVDGMKQSSEVQKEMSDWKSKDFKHAAIAKDMSDKFFAKPKKEDSTRVDDGSANHEVEINYKPMLEDRNLSSSYESSPETNMQQPPGLYPKGSFVNYVA